MNTPRSGDHLSDVILWVWFALTTLAVAYVAQDQFKGGSMEKSLAMKTMRWGWVLLTLYTGVLALVIYWFLHRASARETSEPSLWKQSVESTIHALDVHGAHARGVRAWRGPLATAPNGTAAAAHVLFWPVVVRSQRNERGFMMNHTDGWMGGWGGRWFAVSGAAMVVLFAGCVGVRTVGEKAARQNHQTIQKAYRPGGQRPTLPTLTANSPLRDFLLFAMLNQPQVEAAYYDWTAAVQRITVERSLPDPRLTFQADIAKVVMSLMPGLMMDFPGPGKLNAAASVATAESEAKYFAFELSVLQTAFTFRKACYQLNFLDAKIGVTNEMLRLMGELEKMALIKYEVGKGTLQDVLRARIEQERLTTDIANLDDSRRPLLAQFKASLGLKAEDVLPPVPRKLEATPLDLTAEMLFATALARNPRLKAMEAEVRLAEASLRLANKAKVPDFSAGIEADIKAYPVMVRPSVGVTLPIWRDKIAAQIEGAQSGKRAAEARLSAEQIALAVEFAEKSFMFHEAGRNLELLHERLLTMARQSLEVAQSGYVGGKVDFINVVDAERTLLDFRLSEVQARLQRELALAELSLLILGMPPADAPVLPPNVAPGKERKP